MCVCWVVRYRYNLDSVVRGYHDPTKDLEDMFWVNDGVYPWVLEGDTDSGPNRYVSGFRRAAPNTLALEDGHYIGLDIHLPTVLPIITKSNEEKVIRKRYEIVINKPSTKDNFLWHHGTDWQIVLDTFYVTEMDFTSDSDPTTDAGDVPLKRLYIHLLKHLTETCF